ncbi:hypothetical protein ACB288_13145 [Aeromonas taiwanensis]|uniref:hypothetical protein n=1 Tax=Aeromonas taiwanensis TaxID=633417 RepID=UPI003B9EC27A
MVRLLLLCCLLFVLPVRADTIHVYCDDWPGFCQQDGEGVYLDVVRAIYEPRGYVVVSHLVPYKRALALVSQKGGDMAMGVYRGEVSGVHQPDYPDSADHVTVLMQKRWLPHWTGVQSLKGQEVLWLRGWAFDKFIPVTMNWHEIDNHDMALQLLMKGRYRYYLTDDALYPKGALPPELAQVFLHWIPTYPIFADTEKGRLLKALWDPAMHALLTGGKLAEIYRENRLYDYYRDFIGEQEARARKAPPPGR